jgi:Skp family chaperone for outer membrane proteins
MQLTAAQKMWTRIRPVFKAEFAAFSDDIDGLAKLTHWPNENSRMFFSRLEELVFVLKENYASYRVKPDRPPLIQPQGTYMEDALTKYANDSIDAFANFFFTQMFKAAAPENVRRLLSHKDQSRLTVEEAYKVFFTDHRMEMDKKLSAVHAVTDKFENPVQQEQDVAAFKPQQRQQPRQQNYNRGSNHSQTTKLQRQQQQSTKLQPELQSAQEQLLQKR